MGPQDLSRTVLAQSGAIKRSRIEIPHSALPGPFECICGVRFRDDAIVIEVADGRAAKTKAGHLDPAPSHASFV